MRWLDSVTDYGMNLSKLRREAWLATVHGVARVGHDRNSEYQCRSLCDTETLVEDVRSDRPSLAHGNAMQFLRQTPCPPADWTHLKDPRSVSQVLCFLSRKPVLCE